jgi:replication factor C subunit 1
MNVPPNVMEQLITGAQSDIRQVLNMLSTWRLSKGSMDFEESKQLYARLTFFDVSLTPLLVSKPTKNTRS